MTEQFANFAVSSLAASITAKQTTITVADPTNFPTQGNFRIVVQSFDPTTQTPTSAPEIMLVTAVSGKTFTVTRAAESSAHFPAIAFASGAQVVNQLTAAVMAALAAGGGSGTVTTTGTIVTGDLAKFSSATSITNAVAGSDYITPSGASSLYVPYTGATRSVDLNDQSMTDVFGYYLNANNLDGLVAGLIPDSPGLPIIEFGINANQFGTPNTSYNSWLFRLDCRGSYPGFSVLYQDQSSGSGAEYVPLGIADPAALGYSGTMPWILIGDPTDGASANGSGYQQNLQIYGQLQIGYGYSTGAQTPDGKGLLAVGVSNGNFCVDIYDTSGTGYDIGNSSTGAWHINNAGLGYFSGISPNVIYDSSGSTGAANYVLSAGSSGGSTKWVAAGGGGFTNPMTTLGDIIYENSTPAPARLAGNTTSTKKFLTQTGTGSVSAAPVWNTIASGDVPWSTPGAIGSTTPSTGSFTSLVTSSFISAGTNSVQGGSFTNDGTNYYTFTGVTSNKVNFGNNSTSYHILTTLGAGTDYLAPFTSQTANFFYAAPNGSAGTPTFRAIVAADIPTLNQNTTGSAGSVPFSGITGATNTSAAMVLGTGASLTVSGTGTNNATTLLSATWVSPGAIGSTTPNTGAFTTLTVATTETVGASTSAAASFTINSNLGSPFNVYSSNGNGAAMTFDSTASGGHSYAFNATGGSNGPGYFVVYDATSNLTVFAVNTNASTPGFQLISGATISWSSNSSYANNPVDTGFSRVAAGSLALGNGTAGNKTGNLSLTSLSVVQGSAGNLSGTIALTAGVGTVTITGLTTTDNALITMSVTGGTIGVAHKAVCTTNTLTITAVTSSGTTATTDTSTFFYLIIRKA